MLVEADPIAALEEIKEQINLPSFMDVIIMFCWSLWMQQNYLIFRGIPPSPAGCLQCFKKEFALVILIAKARYKEIMLEWIEAFV